MNISQIMGGLVTYGPMVIAAAAAAAAVFPQGKPGSPWYTIRQIIDGLALNFGNAANKPKP